MSILGTDLCIICDECDNFRKQNWAFCPKCRQELISVHDLEQLNLEKIMKFSLNDKILVAKTSPNNYYPKHTANQCDRHNYPGYVILNNPYIGTGFKIIPNDLSLIKYKIIWDLVLPKLNKFIKNYNHIELTKTNHNNDNETYKKISESLKNISSKIFLLSVITKYRNEKECVILLFTQKELEDRFPILQKFNWICNDIKLYYDIFLYDLYSFIMIYRKLIVGDWREYYINNPY